MSRHLVYCSYCGTEHTVSEGEKECAPGAWDDVVTVPVDGMYEVELGLGDSNGSVFNRRRLWDRFLLWLLRFT